MSNVQSVLVRDYDGLPRQVPTSEPAILTLGNKSDPAATLPSDEASLVSLLKAILSANQSVSKSTTQYSITPELKTSANASTTTALGSVKGVLFEFSYDFVGELNGLATLGSNVASRYFEAPAGGTLSGITYKVTSGTLTIFKMTTV